MCNVLQPCFSFSVIKAKHTQRPLKKYNKWYKNALMKMPHVEMFHSVCIFKGAMKIGKYEDAIFAAVNRKVILFILYSCKRHIFYYII